MKRIRFTFAAVAALMLGVTLAAQLPGPPVGAPQSVQSGAYGYYFAYTFTPNAAAGAGFRVNPTLNLTTATGQTQYAADFAGTIVFPSSTASGTAASTMHVGTAVCTLNSATLTTCANLIIDAEPATGTNKYGLWSKGVTRIDDLRTNAGLTGAAGGLSCGNALAAAGTCGNTAAGTTFKVLVGTYVLASNTSAVTGVSPAFTSSTSYNCVANDITTRANVVQAIPVSGSAFTITNTTGATDTISVICAGN